MAMEKNFDAAASEAALYEKWETSGAFKAGANAKDGADAFCIMIPPPNVTGVLHMGHAFNNTLQDILVRWHRMRGFDTLWQPGQDHAGIATQMVVERQLAEEGIKRTDLGRDKFLEKVWAWKEQSGGTIVEQLKRLGASCDWDRNAFTMAGAHGDTRTGHENSPNFHDAVLKVFVKMYNEGKIYKGKRLVNWDPKFETAISDLEVENIEVDGHMWHFKYPLADGATYTYVEKDEDGNVVLEEERDYISIATTRPETMLGDGAVAVYVSDERYAPLVGKLCEIPVGPKEHRRLIPIITDEYPDPDFGSGAVKITGAHDFNDYQVAKRGGIPMYSLMDTQGNMRADGKPYAEEAAVAQAIANGDQEFDEAMIAAMNLVPDEYRGLDRFEARKRVVADITAEGLAVMTKDEEGAEIPYVENKKIMQPFGDRSKVVIEPMLTDQWFVDTAQIVQPAIDAVRDGTVKILPEGDKKVYFHWLENIEPWCISRQLWWGHQVPVWYGPDIETDCDLPKPADESSAYKRPVDRAFCAATEDEAYAQAAKYYEEKLGREIKVRSEYTEGAIRGWGHDADGKLEEICLYRDPDVLDTWFSSGLWPFGTLGWPENTPELERYYTSDNVDRVLITGFDIIFFWVARMMMMGIETMDKVPFETVYVHPLVRDEKGKKMSKSTGNVLDPLDLIDKYGTDAVRFTLTAMAAMGRDLKLSEDRITGYRNFGTKLWNAARFAEFNEATPVADFDPASATQTLNKWIIGETALVREAVDASLEQYRFNDAANALYAFVWGKVCDWYVELSKPLFQGEDEAVKAETKATLSWVLDQCIILLHPIMPYITEQLWGDIADRANMLVHEDWPTYTSADLLDADASREMNWVVGLIEQIRSVRAEMRVNAGAKIPMVQLELDDLGKAALERNLPMIMRLARIEELTEASEAPKGSVTMAVEGGTFCLPLADIIDVDAEKARLTKLIEKLEKELNGIKGKLSNEKFVNNAPEAVVAENRARIETGGEELKILQEAFERVAALG
ncbi:valine--tRNA ligase [Amylibacter sp. SFDW26]|uniref:valine--tRNA ligase n=1 Tax=Amylibacter sp. SFDW26 TaxID=2652722 RepID=UPI0012622F24|nr:valine--tRNA ligase [Amylibacter sp. SFDW26]KAB7616186.1 valine--tRNA ligase [Amylibacter sp. SFDW26]